MIYRFFNFFEYLPRRIKWFFQKLIRPTHTSDNEVWNLYVHMAKCILPKLKQFKKTPRMGFPMTFSEYEENSGWKDKEEYDQAILDHKITGGGDKAWEEVIDKIIFAFEFVLADNGDKKYEKPFMRKYGNWHAEKPENLRQMNWYRSKEDGSLMLPGDSEAIDLEKYEPTDESFLRGPFYYDMKMHQKFSERAQEGFKLFGEHFQSFWD